MWKMKGKKKILPTILHLSTLKKDTRNTENSQICICIFSSSAEETTKLLQVTACFCKCINM